MSTVRRCSIPGCVNRISKDSKLPQCPLCRGVRFYWYKKSPAQILERRRKLTMYHGRLVEFFSPKGKKIEVKIINEKQENDNV